MVDRHQPTTIGRPAGCLPATHGRTDCCTADHAVVVAVHPEHSCARCDVAERRDAEPSDAKPRGTKAGDAEPDPRPATGHLIGRR